MPITKPVILDETGQRIARALEEANLNAGIVSALDGTKETYKATMRRWFLSKGAAAADADGLTALCDEWYAYTRDSWCGWVDFYQPDISSVSDGVKGGDNAGLVCEPSTDIYEGQDDYAGLPLFACIDVNFIVDPTTLQPKITAIAGITNNFRRNDPNAFVGVMQMSGFIFTEENSDTYRRGYAATTDVPASNVEPLPDAINPDGSFREWVVHAKYFSSNVDSKMTSYAGVIPTGYTSHNNWHTRASVTGEGYSASTTADALFLEWMAYIKYASLTMDGIIQGCCVNDYQYPAQVSEEQTNRILIAANNNMEVGMGVLLGTYNGGMSRTDNADIYSITGQAGAIITAIEEVAVDGETYSAIYTDLDEVFDAIANGASTEGTTYISTFFWPNGTTDSVLGNDGSPNDNTSGKYTGKLQGIEFMPGAYEVIADAILSMSEDEDGAWYEAYVVKSTADQATSITDNYKNVGIKCPNMSYGGSNTWRYMKKKAYKNGVLFPCEMGGSSTTYHRDGFYQAATIYATRAWFLRGALGTGVAAAGLSALGGTNALTTTNYHCASRLSAGGNRGEWAG